MYHPRQEMAQLPKVPQIENGKPDFSSTFQKVELRNLTFFPTMRLNSNAAKDYEINQNSTHRDRLITARFNHLM